MAFNLFKWFLKTSTTDATKATGDFLTEEAQDTGIELWIRNMAFWTCVRRIGSAVAACEFKTYRRGSPVKSYEYWKWNVEPNPNQTKEQFFQKLVGKLYQEQEALIVQDAYGNRYVADSFTVAYDSATGDRYSNVAIWENTTLPGSYPQRDVLHIKLEGAHISTILDAIAAAEGQMIDSAVATYVRSHGKRGVLHIDDTVNTADEDFEEEYRDLVTKKFKTYFTSEYAVLPLFSGYSFEDKSGEEAREDSRDIRKMMDDIMDLTAEAIGIPIAIAKGDKPTDADFTTFLSFVVKPIVNALKQEITRKLYGQTLYSVGSYMDIDMGPVRYIDVFSVATGADKLIGSGVCSINDVLVRLGQSAIEEPWANAHWMTKNYSSAGDLLTQVNPDEEGGSDEEINTETDAAPAGSGEGSSADIVLRDPAR